MVLLTYSARATVGITTAHLLEDEEVLEAEEDLGSRRDCRGAVFGLGRSFFRAGVAERQLDARARGLLGPVLAPALVVVVVLADAVRVIKCPADRFAATKAHLSVQLDAIVLVVDLEIEGGLVAEEEPVNAVLSLVPLFSLRLVPRLLPGLRVIVPPPVTVVRPERLPAGEQVLVLAVLVLVVVPVVANVFVEERDLIRSTLLVSSALTKPKR